MNDNNKMQKLNSKLNGCDFIGKEGDTIRN